MRFHRWTWGRALVVATAASVLLGGLLIVLSGSKGTNAQQREGAPFESYPVRHLSPAELARRLRETLSTLHEEAEIVADNENQKILVRGPGANPRLITQLIQTFDRPPNADGRADTSEKDAPADGPPTVRGYPLPEEQLEAALTDLRTQFGKQPGVRLVIEARTKQIIAVAPPEIHDQIAQRLAGRARPNAGPAPTTAREVDEPPASNPSDAGQPGEATERVLRHVGAREIENQLRTIYGRRMGTTVSPDGESAILALPNRDGQLATISLDRRTGHVRLAGSASSRAALDRLLAALDRNPGAAGLDTEVLPIESWEPERVQKAITALQAALRNDGVGGSTATAVLSRRSDSATRVAAAQGAAAQGAAGKDAAPPAPKDAGAGKDAGPPAGHQAPGEEMGGEFEDTGLMGTVQIEYIDGLDIIIIRGRKRDVERVMRMIQEIEEISQQTKPVIQVYPLKHTNNQALGDLLLQVYDQILSSRQGRVTITPLVKPNAILLIGREESIRTVIELIQKLDQPVAPSAMLRVFPLRHMSATDAELTVRNFFTGGRAGAVGGGAAPLGGGAVLGTGAPLGVGPGGIGPGLGAGGVTAGQGLAARVTIVADYRSNSLIVQASPRDLAEVANLIKQIDVESSPFTAELRVFKLTNSLAQDTATVLQAAIRGQAVTGAAGGQAGGFGGQPGGAALGAGGALGGAAGAGAARQESPRSASLQFVTVDSKGKKVVAAGIASDVVVTADVSNNSILVRGPSRAMELIAAIIEELDTLPDAESALKVFTIVNGDATNLAAMLQQLFGQQVTIGRGTGGLFGAGAGAAAFNVGLQQAGGGGPNAGESTLVPLRFAVDARTNSIIASGSKGDLKVVEALVFRLDEGEVPKRKMSVYKLRNSLAQDVAQAITNFLQSQRQVLQQNQIFNQAIAPFEQLEREMVVVAEPLSNSVIVSSTPHFEKDIERIIKDLDFRPPMVMIQVVLAEVQLDNVYEMGIELGLQDSLLYNRGIAGAAAGTPGFNFNNASTNTLPSPGLPNVSNTNPSAVGSQGLSNLGLGRVSANGLGYGGLVLSAASDSVNILFRALQQTGRLQILSRPQVMAIHNRSAQVNVGQRVPRFRGATNTNAGVTQNIEDVDIGLILNIIPQINEDGIVVLNVQIENSALGNVVLLVPSGTGNVPIQAINNVSSMTTISAKDGQTVIFGGLIQVSKTLTVNRVPYLSDIPAIGKLFEFTSDKQQRRELLIVMTPKIVKNDEDYDWIKAVESERMSWCLADVVNIHGDVGLRGSNCVNCRDDLPVIYPDRDPTGLSYPLHETYESAMPTEPVPSAPPAITPLVAPESVTPPPDGESSRRLNSEIVPAVETSSWNRPLLYPNGPRTPFPNEAPVRVIPTKVSATHPGAYGPPPPAPSSPPRNESPYSVAPAGYSGRQ